MSAAPIIKWCGGKTKLLGELRSRMPETYGCYYEPFFGGGALFFAVSPEKAVVADMNGDLVWLYREVAKDVSGVILALTKMRSAYANVSKRPELYYTTRKQWNEGFWKVGTPEHAAAFIFLNKTCFNGLWRVNKKGGFNAPIGAYKNPSFFQEDTLCASATLLAKSSILCSSFEETVASAQKGDFVYFDPPYDPINKTSNFTSYTKDKFGDEHQEQLAKLSVELIGRGVRVMISNNDTPLIRNLYKGFTVDVVQCTRPINSKGSKRGAVNEVIITG